MKLLIPISLKGILLPFPLPSGYWFVYSYVVMLFAMPFLNIIINSLERAKLLMLISGLIILWSFLVIGCIVFNDKPGTSIDDFGYTSTTFFFLLYFIAAYVRKYSGKILNSKKYTAIGFVVGLLLAVVCSYLADSQKLFNGILDTFDKMVRLSLQHQFLYFLFLEIAILVIKLLIILPAQWLVFI